MLGLYCGALVLQSMSAGVQAAQRAAAAKYQYQSAAMSAEYKGKVAELNAKIAANDLVTNQLATQRNIGIEGMKAAQSIAGLSASVSHSGVYMNSASKHEVVSSAQFTQAVNHAAQEENRVNQLIQDQNKIAAYKGEEVLARGNAESQMAMANSIDKTKAGWIAGLNTFTSGLNSLAMTGAFNEIEVPFLDMFRGNKPLQKPVDKIGGDMLIAGTSAGGIYNGEFDIF